MALGMSSWESHVGVRRREDDGLPDHPRQSEEDRQALFEDRPSDVDRDETEGHCKFFLDSITVCKLLSHTILERGVMIDNKPSLTRDSSAC